MYYVEHKGCFIDYNYMDFSKGNNQTNKIIMGIIWDLQFSFYEFEFQVMLIDKLCLIQFSPFKLEYFAR